MITVLHNPRCSKSRETLELLKQHGIAPHVVLYLETPPNSEQLKTLLLQLGLKPRDLLRSKEAEYAELGLDDLSLSDDALLAAMVAHPRLIERPIVSDGKRAAIGRPPEAVLELLA